jgi:glutathione-specific gamma-glutamylcyclotransferase
MFRVRPDAPSLIAFLLFGATLGAVADPPWHELQIISMERESVEARRVGGSRALHPAPEVAKCVADGCDVWIFGYGSLMWDPGFAFVEARPGLLRGYHRSFCVYSHRYRGTPERPGLVLGLDRGGACKGIAYRVPAADVASALHYLWEREMANRTYHLKEVALATAGGTVMARSFAVDRTHKNYAGRLPLEETARLILQGIGARGPCRQYLENTVRELKKLGLVDGPLHRLEAVVEEMAARVMPCAQ